MPDTDAERRRGEYTLSFDPARLDVNAIHAYLSRSYWAAGISIELVRRSIPSSLCVGVYQDADGQAGFAALSRTAPHLPTCATCTSWRRRGCGLAKWMMEAIITYPDLQGLRRFILVTRRPRGLPPVWLHRTG